MDFDPDVDHTHEELRVVRQAALRHPEAGKYLDLVVRRRLDEGFSAARVYEAEWQSAGAADNHWSVVKIDQVHRLEREALLSQRFPDAQSFTRVAATSFGDGKQPADSLGCLFYTHAAAVYPGKIVSLADAFRQALDGDGDAETHARELVEKALGVLRKQLHQGEADQPGPGGRQLMFYLQRWLPTAVVECRQVELDPDRGVLRLFEKDYEAEAEVELGRDEEVDQRWLERRISFEAERLFLTESEVFVNVPERACFQVDGVPPGRVREALGDREPVVIRVAGKLVRTRRSAYAERLRAFGLDPEAETFEIADLTFRNPLPGLQKRVRGWARRDPRPLYSFGHGDLHGGNVLCVETNLAIIDHAMAGDGQPCCADAARLVGSLWRTAIAPALSRDEVAIAVDQAFRRPEVAADGKAGAERRVS